MEDAEERGEARPQLSDAELAKIIDEVITFGIQWRYLSREDLERRLQVLGQLTRDAIEVLSARAKAEGIARWKKWLNEDADKGSARAHSMSKLHVSQAWTGAQVGGYSAMETGTVGDFVGLAVGQAGAAPPQVVTSAD